jgi:threonine synthase
MRYISTRGQAPACDFATAVLQGLAPDGGLYLPETWPRFSEADLLAMRDLSYPQLAARIIQPFVGDTLSPAELQKLINESYATFDAPDVTPLVKLGDDQHYLLELFHGPTLAFKDVALQFLGRLFDVLLKKSGRHATVIGATSGDTGSAAIAGCMATDNLRVFILFPQQGPSEIQRRQMTTVAAQNVHALAIDGTFDDCQRIVKQLFADTALNQKHNFLAVNSINWARIMAQIVYYFYAALRAAPPGRAVSFVVPTGNFGNIFAAYAAGKMGLPIAKLVAATNSNDAVQRFFSTGTIVPSAVTPSISPSMDIQIPSNLERLLFDLCDGDAAKLRALMAGAASPQGLQITPLQLGKARQFFTAGTASDAETLQAIKTTYAAHKYILDPHSAVGVAVGGKLAHELPLPIIHLGCAHPAKFPETIKSALGRESEKPKQINNLYDNPERVTLLPADTARVVACIAPHP